MNIGAFDADKIAKDIHDSFRLFWPRAFANRLEFEEIKEAVEIIMSYMREQPGVTWRVTRHGVYRRHAFHDAFNIIGRVSPLTGTPSMWIVMGRTDENTRYPMGPHAETARASSVENVAFNESLLPDIEPTYDGAGPVDPSPSPRLVTYYLGMRIEKFKEPYEAARYVVGGKPYSTMRDAKCAVSDHISKTMDDFITEKITGMSTHQLNCNRLVAQQYAGHVGYRVDKFYLFFREWSIRAGAKPVPTNQHGFALRFLLHASTRIAQGEAAQ